MPITRKNLSKALHTNLPVYHDTKGAMIEAINSRLSVLGAHVADCDGCINLPNNEGRKLLTVWTDSDEEIGNAYVAWFRVPSGRYELTAYIT